MVERRWGEPEGGGGQSVPAHDLSGNMQPRRLSQGLGGHCERKEEEALREAGAGQPCPLRWKWSPGLPKPLFDCALVIPSLWPWEKASASGVPVSRLCECQYAQSLGRVRLCDPRHCSLPGPLCPWDFPGNWSGSPFPPPGHLPDPGIVFCFGRRVLNQ